MSLAASAVSGGAGARWAARGQFFASGFIFATWGIHVPTVKVHYALDEMQLGFAMLAAGVGALSGASLASRLIGRFGLRRVAAGSGAVYALFLGGLVSAPGYAGLLGVLLGFGVMTSVFDVAINTEAAHQERVGKTPSMSAMHGMFSLGGMAGALTGGAALAGGVLPAWHLASVALAMAAAILWASTRLPPRAALAAFAKPPGLPLPHGRLLLLGVLAALGLAAEGAMYDWSVLYMQQELRSPQQLAALAYASFSAAMAAARFAGDPLRARFMPSALLRASALLAAGAMSLALLTHSPWVALIGFAGAGIGFANVVPILFSAAARVPGIAPEHGIAAVSAAGYLAFMAGPPAIGFVAKASSLSAALALVVIFALALGASAKRAGLR